MRQRPDTPKRTPMKEVGSMVQPPLAPLRMSTGALASTRVSFQLHEQVTAPPLAFTTVNDAALPPTLRGEEST